MSSGNPTFGGGHNVGFTCPLPAISELPAALVLFLYCVRFSALNHIYPNPHKSSRLSGTTASLTKSTCLLLSSLRSAAEAPISQKGWICPGHCASADNQEGRLGVSPLQVPPSRPTQFCIPAASQVNTITQERSLMPNPVRSYWAKPASTCAQPGSPFSHFNITSPDTAKAKRTQNQKQRDPEPALGFMDSVSKPPVGSLGLGTCGSNTPSLPSTSRPHKSLKPRALPGALTIP